MDTTMNIDMSFLPWWAQIPLNHKSNVSFPSLIASFTYFGYSDAKVTDTTLFKSSASETHSSFCQIMGICPIAFESQPETVVS